MFFVTVNFEDNDNKDYRDMCEDYHSFNDDFPNIQKR